MNASASDVLSSLEFQDELRRLARFDAPSAAEDPLAAAVKQIEQNPAYTQSRLLARILSALTDGSGDFRRAELSAFDTPTRKIVIALMNAVGTAKTSPAQWTKAVDTAAAALLRAEH